MTVDSTMETKNQVLGARVPLSNVTIHLTGSGSVPICHKLIETVALRATRG